MARLDDTVLREFAFVDGGRTFTCAAESQRSRPEAWWWFHVSTDDRHRYAPFRTSEGDTPESLQPRIVEYYENLLFRRSQPARPYWRKGAAAEAPAESATIAAAGPVEPTVASD
jgi:hypothetical protein